jgi:hypothetical protein
VNTAKIVVHEVKRNRVGMIVDLLAECIGQGKEKPLSFERLWRLPLI